MMSQQEAEGTENLKVTVKLFASFRTGRTPIETCDYPAGTTVADVVSRLGIPVAELGIMLINHRHVKLERVLADGDTLAIFPLLGGG
jgi:molybdopterin converting factor small subunit